MVPDLISWGLPNLCVRWETYLLDILKGLGLSVEREKKAWSLSHLLRWGTELPSLECLEVVGPLGGSKTDCPKLAVDGAANVLDEYDFLLSDLDGADEDEVIRSSKDGLLFLVIHGDNFEKVLSLPLGDEVVPVVQSPRARGLCVPAFSDGDKALFVAHLISKKVFVSGFGEGEQPRATKRRLVHPLKERKLSLSRALGLEGSLGSYWGRPLDEGEC